MRFRDYKKIKTHLLHYNKDLLNPITLLLLIGPNGQEIFEQFLQQCWTLRSRAATTVWIMLMDCFCKLKRFYAMNAESHCQWKILKQLKRLTVYSINDSLKPATRFLFLWFSNRFCKMNSESCFKEENSKPLDWKT